MKVFVVLKLVYHGKHFLAKQQRVMGETKANLAGQLCGGCILQATLSAMLSSFDLNPVILVSGNEIVHFVCLPHIRVGECLLGSLGIRNLIAELCPVIVL